MCRAECGRVAQQASCRSVSCHVPLHGSAPLSPTLAAGLQQKPGIQVLLLSTKWHKSLTHAQLPGPELLTAAVMTVAHAR